MKRRAKALVLALFLVLYVGPLFLPLTSVQEARRAEIVQEVVKFGHWLIPHLNGRPYVVKPPLYTWLAGIVASVLGVSEATLRLSSLLAAAGILFLTYKLARKLGGPLCAFLAVFFLLGAPRFYFFAHRVELELLVAFFFEAYLYLSWRYLEEGGKWRLLGAFGALGGGFLTKGPFILLALPPIVLYGLYHRRRRLFTLLLHPLGWLLALTPSAAWYLYVHRHLPPSAFSEFIQEDFFGRLITGKRDPFYHYARALFLGFLPESLLLLRLPSFLRIQFSREDRQFVLFSWLTPLVFLSFTAAKFSKYLLSFYPFFALSLALAAGEWFGDQEELLRHLTLGISLLLLCGSLLVEIRGNALRFESLARARPYISAPRVYFYRKANYWLVFYRGTPIKVLQGPPFPPGLILEETYPGVSALAQRKDLRLVAQIVPFYREGRALLVYSSAGAPSASSGSGK